MPEIIMLETKLVAQLGSHVETFEAGCVYDAPDHIAECLIAAGWAKLNHAPREYEASDDGKSWVPRKKKS